MTWPQADKLLITTPYYKLILIRYLLHLPRDSWLCVILALLLATCPTISTHIITIPAANDPTPPPMSMHWSFFLNCTDTGITGALPLHYMYSYRIEKHVTVFLELQKKWQSTGKSQKSNLFLKIFTITNRTNEFCI